MISRSLSNHLRQEPVELYSDIQLIELLQEGNERAFHLLIQRWNEVIFNFCLRITGDPDDAAECTQKTFIKVHQKIESLNSPDAFKSWIYRIALNQCRDELKRKSRFRFLRFGSNNDDSEETFGNANEPETLDMNDNPEIGIHQSQLKTILEKALLKIPADQREVVVMKELQQFTFSEIAKVLDIPESTIKSRLYNGLRALQKILKNQRSYPI
jgi:RNA polymerase sigma-70 factor (ECF subfamily)